MPETNGTNPIEAASTIARAWSEELGDTVQQMDAQWTRYAAEGLIVELHLGRERYQLQLSLENLGLKGRTPEEDQQLRRTVKPGHVYLLPYDVIARCDTIDSNARECLKRHSFRTMWGRWIHKSRYAAWRIANLEIQAEYAAEMEAVLVNYERHRSDAIQGYLGLLSQTWNTLSRTAAGQQIEGFMDRTAWIEAQIERLVTRIPTPDEIRRKHTYEWEVWMIPLQAQIEQDRIEAGDLRLIAAEREMLADVEASAKANAKAGVQGFLAEIQAQIQTQVCTVAEGALAVMQGNAGKVGRNSSVAIGNLIRATQDLVFWQDADLEANLRALKSIMDVPSKKRNPEQLRSTLLQLGATARLALMDLTPSATRASAAQVGIPDDLDELQGIARRSTARTADDLIFELDDTLPVTRGSQRQADEVGAL